MVVAIRLRYLVLTALAFFAVQAATVPIAVSLAQQGVTAAPVASAPLGTAFAYQGRLAVDGVAADGTYDLRFTLHDALTDGAIIAGPLSRDNVAVANGLFTVSLDFGSTAFNGSDRFLAVEAKADDVVDYDLLTPRQQLTAAPYALYAGNGAFWKLGGNAGTNPATDFIGTTDAVPFEVKAGGLRVLRFEPGLSPNIIGGFPGNSVAPGFIGATIAGGGDSGTENQVLGDYGSIGGGAKNAVEEYASIGGGFGNQATGLVATIGGGTNNTATGQFPTIAGGRSNTAGEFASVGGGDTNSASGSLATVGGGEANTASSVLSTIGGGQENTALGHAATVSGGRQNEATGEDATVGGGLANEATTAKSTIGGGFANDATGTNSTVGGGSTNTASGNAATVPGGSLNLAQGNSSFAAGFRAKASGQGSFVWSDSRPFDFGFLGNNTFQARATGGFFLTFEINPGSGAATKTCFVDAAVMAWQCPSDRNLKTDLRPVDGKAVLQQLQAVPIQFWRSKDAADSTLHLGPMAQDFYAAFGLGDSDTTIATIDLDGVALAGIKGLHGMVNDQDARIAALEALVRVTAGGSVNGAAPTATRPVKPVIDRGAGFALATTIGLLALAIAVHGSHPRQTRIEHR